MRQTDRSSSKNAHSTDWARFAQECLLPSLPLLFPYAAILGGFVIGIIALTVPEDQRERRDAGLGFAATFLAIGATALQVGATQGERRRSPMANQGDLREGDRWPIANPDSADRWPVADQAKQAAYPRPTPEGPNYRPTPEFANSSVPAPGRNRS